MLKKFFLWNRAICEPIGQFLPHGKAHRALNYAHEVAGFIDAHPGASVVDVGAGKRCLFVEYMRDPKGARIVGVDISQDEMIQNLDLSERHVADVCKALPFPDESFDAVVSHSVLEHLDSQDRFFSEAARVLKPGGVFIHWLPNRFAPFAIANQILPHWLSRKMLGFTWEESKGICGFRAHYDHCHPRGMQKLLDKYGFVDSRIRVSYYSSSYYAFFLPFYLLSIAYEVVVSALNLKQLSSVILVKAKKPERE